MQTPTINLATALTLITTLAGCGLDESPESDDPEAAFAVEEPVTGEATIQTIYGERDVTYAIIDGHAIFEGDIDLGPVDENGELVQMRNVVVDSSSLLWSGDIPFQIDEDLVDPERVNDAIEIIESQSSVRFRARTENDTDFIYFTTSGTPGVSFSPVGRQGGQQNVQIWTTHSPSVIVHEVLHSLGFFHEQTRNDRDDFIEVHEECIIDKWEYAFEVSPDTVDLEPYDDGSIMHYGPGNFCVRNEVNACVCPTMTLLDGVTPVTGSSGTLTANDINTLYRLYNKAVGAEEANDWFGYALAVGDFDDDGYQDLAVGSPYEEIGSVMAGAVAVYKGNSYGRLAPWMMLTQSGSGLAVDEEVDEFGMALAVGDFDNDGIDDLAVGAPGEAIGQIEAGVVFLFEGSPTGLSGWQLIHQATAPALAANESGDRFGAALAAADFDLDGKDDLAVGAPREDVGLIQDSGWVFVFEGSANGVVPAMGFGQGDIETDETGDEFGYALAVGRLNADSYWDLVVGSPEWSQGSGSAFVFAGSNTGLNAFDQLRQSDVGGANEEDDYFGVALAIADFSGDGRDDLAVGTPGEDVGNVVDAGYVFMFKPVGNSINGWHGFGQSGLAFDEAHDYFGSSLAAGEVWNTGFGNQDDLVVGAPGENIEAQNVSNAGAAFVFSGGGANMVGRAVIVEDTTLRLSTSTDVPASESYDEFGRELAIGDFDGDGDGDLVVGVPLEDNDSGSFVHFPNVNGENAFTYVMPIQQSFQQRLW
jgi:hypothetical protein